MPNAVTLTGTERTDSCRGCLAGRDKNGPGAGKPFSRSQIVIRVRKSRFIMKCKTCGTKNARKLNRLTIKPKGKK